MRFVIFFGFLLVSMLWPLTSAEAQIKTSGLPVPRFVSLKSDKVNMRTGPGTRYPVSWVYHKQGLPVEITAEYDNWRRIRDIDGAQGWVHVSVLSGRRTGLSIGNPTKIYEKANQSSSVVAVAEERVHMTLESCTPTWCRVSAAGFQGWVLKPALWGVYSNEIID